MRGVALPRDRSQLRTCSGKETVGGCKLKGSLDSFVVIDVECDGFPDVIIVDVPEDWQKKFHGSDGSRGQKTFPFEDVISIDDEEDDDVEPPGNGVDCHPESDSNATSGKKSFHACSSVQNSGQPAGEILAPSSSKCGLAYSAKVPSRSHYGLDPESESGSSDSDCSDCELIDSSFEMFREKWEKASLKRRNGAHKAKSDMVDQASASGCHSDYQLNVAVENRTEKHQETGVFSGSSNGKFETGKQSTGLVTSGSNLRLPSSQPRANMHFKHSESGDQDQEGSLKRSPHLIESHTGKDEELSEAEEAHRLRKRKEAETLRLLDVERRQKQRVEEVRETQKKDEEYMSLKEQIQVEIRKKLNILELTSINMAMILRGLGISVGGGFRPPSDEVHAAYKRAMLRFHPDRASRTDIRQQVEAEEKFKLITRMKEKYRLDFM